MSELQRTILSRISEYISCAHRTNPAACLILEDAAAEITKLQNVMTENAMLERDNQNLEIEVVRLRGKRACDSCGYVTGVFNGLQK